VRTASRVAIVTLALAGVGAVLGALAGVVSLAVVWTIAGGASWLGDAGLLLYPAVVGGALGAVLAPALSWLFLRRVALWRVLVYPPLGTLAGVTVTALLRTNPIVGAACGTLLATIALALTARRRGRAAAGGASAGAGRDDA